MKTVLCIPHQPHRNLRVRAIEIASYLARTGDYRVLLLSWEPGQETRPHLISKLTIRGKEALQSATTLWQIEPDSDLENLFRVQMPYLLAPWPVCQRFNQYQAGRLIVREKVDAIINASAYHFPVPRNTGCRYIYDIVDDHISPDSGPHWQRTRQFTLGEMAKADHISVISHGLMKLAEDYGLGQKVERVPNGVNPLACASPEAVQSLRSKYRLAGCFTVAYIGNHGWWSGLHFLLDVFADFHRQHPESRLVVVGPGEEIAGLQRDYTSESVIFTGPVPPQEASAWFQVTDIGVLPFDLCPFTHNALPLKVLEYGAARKQVLASPLHELSVLALPFVQLLPLEKERWVQTLSAAAQHAPVWDSSWDEVVQAYDWQQVLQPIRQWLEAP
jgi:glycosyltransferase involved in cell wall biosynthesis